MLDLKRLKMFYEVARLGSFSAAASGLDYSQPAVSHHVGRLELELGAKLLVRGPRGVTLTPIGRMLMTHASAILSAVEDAETDLSQMLGRSGHQLKMSAFTTGCATLVPDAVAAFRTRWPEVGLRLVEAEPEESIERLISHELQIAVVYDTPARPLALPAQLTCTYFAEDPMLLVLPVRHALADLPAVPLAALANSEWIEGAGRSTPSSLILFDACAQAGFEPRIAFNSGNYEAVQRLVAVGLGVALVPSLGISSPAPGIVVRPLEESAPVRRIGVVTLDAPSASEFVAAMSTALVIAGKRFLGRRDRARA